MPSFEPKCSYTIGFETPARCAISSIEVASKPRSANSPRETSSSCARRCWPDIRTRLVPSALTPGTVSRAELGEALRRRPADVVGPAGLLEHPDQPCRRVELAAVDAVARR